MNAAQLRLRRFVRDLLAYTPFARLVLLLVGLWVLFSFLVYLAEQRSADSPIGSFHEALYWGVAAFSTAGIADTPTTALGRLAGGVWIVIGSILFFGTVVATVTFYFMRPMQRPGQRIIETIELNLERLDDLSVDELETLRESTDALIDHVERLKLSRDSDAGQRSLDQD